MSSVSASPGLRHALVAVLAVVVGVHMLYGGRLDYAGCRGCDAHVYIDFARDPVGKARTDGIPADRITRLLPSAIVHATLRALAVEPTDGNVARAFAWLTYLSIVGAGWAFLAALARLGVRGPVGALAFAALFGTFETLRIAPWAPIATDSVALFLGAACLVAYVSRARIALAALTVVSAFTWPTSLPTNVALLAFPPRAGEWRAVGPAATATVLVAVVGFWVAVLATAPIALLGGSLRSPAWAAGFVVAVAYVGLGAAPLVRVPRTCDAVRWGWRDLVAAGLVLLLIVAIYVVLRNAVGRAPTGIWNLRGAFAVFQLRAMTWPAIFLVSHVGHFGPVILLLGLFWPQVCAVARRTGFGTTALLVFYLFFALDSESRHLLFGMPFLVSLLAVALDEQWLRLRPRFVVTFLFLAVVWLKPGFAVGSGFAGSRVSPAIMDYGPWATTAEWRVNVALALASLGALAASLGSPFFRTFAP